jgi:hypothetical protein
MIYVAHRGNVNGRDPDLENTVDYCLEAHKQDYWLEVDLWAADGLFLGHDGPVNEVSKECGLFVGADDILIHAKDLNTVRWCIENGVHWFFHEGDEVTCSSRGYPISHVRNGPVFGVISMVFEYGPQVGECLGVCSDEVFKYRFGR